jgi:hypothetical protein
MKEADFGLFHENIEDYLPRCQSLVLFSADAFDVQIPFPLKIELRTSFDSLVF